MISSSNVGVSYLFRSHLYFRQANKRHSAAISSQRLPGKDRLIAGLPSGGFLSHRGTPMTIIHVRLGFPWNKSSSYWGTPMTSLNPPCLRHLFFFDAASHPLPGGKQIIWGMPHPSCTTSWAARVPSISCDSIHQDLPSGKRLQSYGKSQFSMGISTIHGHFHSRDAIRSLFWEGNKPVDRRKVSFPAWNKRFETIEKVCFPSRNQCCGAAQALLWKQWKEKTHVLLPKLTFFVRKRKFPGSKPTFFRNLSLKLETQSKLRWN